MAGDPLFDINAFLDTRYKGGMDINYVLPPEGDYTAQSTDRLSTRSGTIAEGDRAGEMWAAMELWWELTDEKLRHDLHMDHVLVRQSIMLDFNQDAWKQARKVELDWSPNRNMKYKRLIEATGLNAQKDWNANMLKHQPALVKVEHRRIDGFDDPMAEVTRVMSLKAKRAAA